MNKYIVKNCPAGQIVTSAINPNMAGVYCKKEHGPCQDFKDCVLKKIFKECKEDWKDPTVDNFQLVILKLLEPEEV